MKLFEIDSGAEQDWFAASSQEEALRLYRNHYGLSDSDMDGVTAGEVAEPDAVEVYTDETDTETDEPVTKTAAEVMAEMKHGGLVCSTCE